MERWNKGVFFNYVFEVEESLSTCKYLLEKFSQERKIDYCGKKSIILNKIPEKVERVWVPLICGDIGFRQERIFLKLEDRRKG